MPSQGHVSRISEDSLPGGMRMSLVRSFQCSGCHVAVLTLLLCQRSAPISLVIDPQPASALHSAIELPMAGGCTELAPGKLGGGTGL